ncbi:IS481 family transposase [Pararhodospirillum photometricum]|uniref:IS481 family transposase n=1 Tax=Pararhodospirillum photometricum TaxID=1084 RepID=UPI0009D9517B|nr:IS481 family transposase [Pararhodospirillum photometricum]
MLWKCQAVLDQRKEFVRLARQGGISIQELCRRFGISRDTGHRLLKRYEESGEAGLEDRSRRPSTSPRRTDPLIEEKVLEVRDRHPAWGGRKIARRLTDMGLTDVPSPSTINEILRRNGRINPVEARKHQKFIRFQYENPNDLWQMDFKGHFPMAAGRCHPLTVLDDHSRYALGLRACENEKKETVQDQLVSIFQRYGLPARILADNGSPWGCCGNPLETYTSLEVWLMLLGVRLIHGRPLHPQTQGKDERFHRTLKIELLQSRRFDSIQECQKAFDGWLHVYNDERPHEALGLSTPSSRYRASLKSFPEAIPLPEYYESDVVRRVKKDGCICFKGNILKISQAFAGYNVAFRPTQTEGVWDVYFAGIAVAYADLRDSDPIVQSVRHVSEQVSDMSPV